MTLDDAVKYMEMIAEKNQRVIDTGIVFGDVTLDMLYCDDTEVIDEQLAYYQEAAENYRQIADWLKEFKQLKEQTSWIPVSDPLNELPKDKKLLVTVEEEIFPGKKCRYVTELYYDMTEWVDDINDAKNAVAYQYYPEPYAESGEET